MKIPKALQIGGHNIEVSWHSEKENDLAGYYDNKYDFISICNNFSESKEAEIFLHEIIEAIKYKFDLDLKHKDLVVLSEVLFSVLRNNKLEF